MSTIARFSLSEYDHMIECGVFDASRGRRIEFIRGKIREMTPIGSVHEEVLDRLNEWSFKRGPIGRCRVRIQESLGIPGSESAPEPDLAWVLRQDYSQERPHAVHALLVVEVAESSLAYDRGEKAHLYAEAGIADYWVVNIPDRSIEVHREPKEGRYQSIRAYAAEEEVRPLAFLEAALRPSMLFAAEGQRGGA
jgi:Uma2 family endonuclease